MSPKQLFQLDKPRVTAHNEMVGSPLFTSSANTALLQMQENLLGHNALGEKALNHYARLEGARQFLQIFNDLGRAKEAESPQGLPPNLNH